MPKSWSIGHISFQPHDMYTCKVTECITEMAFGLDTHSPNRNNNTKIVYVVNV